jgi:Carboxypeptidase regulatory-like domain
MIIFYKLNYFTKKNIPCANSKGDFMRKPVLKALTNETGAYAFLSVPPGLYNVTAELLGFKTSVRSGVQIGTAAQVRVNFTLEIGERADRVEITASSELALIETSATVGDILPEYRIRQLPMATNNILDLLDILPGFEFGPPGFGGVGSTETVAGLSMNTVNMTRDGLTLSDFRYDPQTWGRQVMSPTSINPDLVGEIRLILTPVDAEIGRGNGQIQIQTRSGTNRFTGTANWSVRNSALNANTWSNNLNTTNGVWDPTPLDWTNSHQYSASLGGPIIRNKTFFFALWDQQITRSRELQSPTVLTDTARLGIFRYWSGWNPTNYLADEATLNFPVSATTATVRSVNDAGLPVAPTRNPDGSAYTGSLRCFSVFGNMRLDGQGGLVPFTNADCTFGSVVGQAVLGPSGGGIWDPVRATFDSTGFIRKVLSNMPQANYFGGGDGLNTAQHRWLQGLKGSNEGNAARGGDSLVSRKQINLKIDQNLSQHRINGSWSMQLDNSEDLLSSWPGGLHGAIQRRPNVFTVNVTSTLSSDLLNEARFGLNRNTTDRAPAWLHPSPSIRQEAQDLITVPGGVNPLTGERYTVVVNPGLGAGVSSIGNGFMSVGTFVIGSSLVGNVTPLYNVADTVSWTRGRHAFKFGADVRIASSRGWNQPPFPIVTLGNSATNTVSPFGTLTNFASELPGFLATARGTATNLNYWLAGSVSSVQAPYWITSHQDVVNGQDPTTPPIRRRDGRTF